MFKDLEVSKFSVGKFYKSKKSILIILIMGIVFVLASNIIKKSKTGSKKFDTSNNREFVDKIQEDLSNMISSIDGAGKSKVLVTIDEGEEVIYATEKRQNTQTITDEGLSNSQLSKRQTDDSEKKYIITKDSDGNEIPMIVKKIEPKIRGAVISCQGAKNKEVRENIIKLVSVALDITPNKICITKFRN